VAICTSCGNQAQVPFKPRMDKPVYCSDCFRQIRPD
jgi:CxxC-x17-CxxC domain-containing protein